MEKYLKSLAHRRAMYPIDPEEFDRIFAEEWRKANPGTYQEFADHLNETLVLPPTAGAMEWTRYSTNNHVRRLAHHGIVLRPNYTGKLYILDGDKRVEIPDTWH